MRELKNPTFQLWVLYGAVRSESKIRLLEQNEIVPVVCTLAEVPQYIRQLEVSAVAEAHLMTEDHVGVTRALLDALPDDGRYL